jgi:hypothetical protein
MALHARETREARFTRDPDLVDDVTAETFLVAWRRINELPENAAAWPIGVARNVRRNTHRSARRQEAVSARLADAVPPLEDRARHTRPLRCATPCGISHRATARCCCWRSGTGSTGPRALRRSDARAPTSACACTAPGAGSSARSPCTPPTPA